MLNDLAALFVKIANSSAVGVAPPHSARIAYMQGGAGSAVSIVGAGGSFLGEVAPTAGPSVTIFDDGGDALGEFIDLVLGNPDLRGCVSSDSVRERVVRLLRTYHGRFPEKGLPTVLRVEVLDALRSAIGD